MSERGDQGTVGGKERREVSSMIRALLGALVEVAHDDDADVVSFVGDQPVDDRPNALGLARPLVAPTAPGLTLEVVAAPTPPRRWGARSGTPGNRD